MADSEKTTFSIIAGGEILKLPCNECCRVTRHQVMTGVRADYEWTDGHNSVDGKTDTHLVQCQGCEVVSTYRESSNTEDRDWESGEYHVTTAHYPPRDAHRARFESHQLPAGLQGVYLETLKAINEGQPILAAIGVRAMVEAICTDQGAEGRTLEIRIDALRDRNLVTIDGAKCLHMLRTAGNNAAHEVKRHTGEQLLVAMGVVENIIEATYHLPDAVNSAFVEKPARRARLAAALMAPAPALPRPVVPALPPEDATEP
jgi:hypothetical protein